MPETSVVMIIAGGRVCHGTIRFQCGSPHWNRAAALPYFADPALAPPLTVLGIPTGSLSNCSTDPTVMFFALASLDHNCRSLEVDMSGDKNGAPADCSKPACKSALKKLNNKCRHLLPTTGNSATEKNADYILNCAPRCPLPTAHWCPNVCQQAPGGAVAAVPNHRNARKSRAGVRARISCRQV